MTRADSQAHAAPAGQTLKQWSLKRLCLLLVLISVAVYGNTIVNGYAVDDLAMIEKNTLVQKGFAGIPELMTTPRLAGFDRHIVNENYRPLSLVLFAIEYQLFGLNPAIGHLFNIAFFAGCVALLFLFVVRICPEGRGVAFMAAALFAVHPLHTEVVANIKSRDELMSFFFGFAALLAYLRYVQDGRPARLLAGGAMFALALLSKEAVISFVVVVPLLFYFFTEGDKRRKLMVSGMTAVVACLFLVVRALVLRHHDSSAVPFLDNPLAGAAFFTTRLPTAIYVLGYYLRLLFVPWPLICDYSYNTLPLVGFGNIWVWVSLAAYGAMFFYAVRSLMKKQQGMAAFGVVFYLLSIALFSHIFFLAYSELAERLAFLASTGWCIGVAAALYLLAQRRGARALAWLIAAPVCVAFGYLTVQRNMDWKDDMTLFSTDIVKAPENARMWHSLGSVLITTQANEDADSVSRLAVTKAGIEDIRRSLSIYPGNYKAHQEIGNYFRGIGQFDSAEYHARAALRLYPGSATLTSDLGFIYFSAQKYDQALATAEKALAMEPGNAALHANVAMVLMVMKRYDSSLFYFEQAAKLEPGNKQAAMYIPVLKTPGP